MIRLFLGYDRREAVGFHACVQSVIETASASVAITPISGEQRDGTNAFIYERFMVPAMCGYEGWAIFADGSDMLFMEDVAELWAMRDERYAVQVVKHAYQTRHPRKYLGTSMEADNRDYPRKNWSSLILWNCGHRAHRDLTTEYVAERDGAFLHRFGWLLDDEIGVLPTKWNVLIGEDGDSGPCAVAHFTLGIPAMRHYFECRYAEEWRTAAQHAGRCG